MDIEINTFDGIKLKTANTYVEEDINLSVSDKAFEEILYDGEVENGTLGANRLAGYLNGTVTEITKEDLAGATKIRSYLFYFDPITSIDIPNTVTSIGTYAFYECSKLTNVTFEENSQVTSIGGNAFQKCSELTSIYIPNSVTYIISRAFYVCSKLVDVTVDNSVQNLTIQSDAFYVGSNTNKATIRFLGTTPPSIQSSTFVASHLEKIIVPKGCRDAYKSATNWSAFAEYIEEATE